MAVGFDAVSQSHTGAAGSISQASFTWNHAGASPRGVLIFTFTTNVNAQPVTTITYGGVNIPAVANGQAADTTTEPGVCKAWFLGSGVPTGTQAVVVNRTNNTNEVFAVCITITADSDTDYTGILLSTNNQTLAQKNINDGSPGTDSMRFAGLHSGALTPAVGNNTTGLVLFNPSSSTTSIMVARETVAGQGSRPIGWTYAGSDDVGAVYLAVIETGVGGGSNSMTLTAAVTFVGGPVKQPSKLTSGAVTPAGIIQKLAQRIYTGALTAAAALLSTRVVARTLTAAVSLAGSVVKVSSRVLSAAVTPAHASLKQTQRTAAGTLTNTGALLKAFPRVCSGAVTFTGVTLKQTGKFASGAVTFVSGVVRSVAQKLSSSLSVVGAVLKQGQKPFIGLVTFGGSLVRQAQAVLIGTLTSAANIVTTVAGGILSQSRTIARGVYSRIFSRVN